MVCLTDLLATLASASDPRFAIAITNRNLLFDLSQDPGENHDLAGPFPERLESMKSLLKQIQSKSR